MAGGTNITGSRGQQAWATDRSAPAALDRVSAENAGKTFSLVAGKLAKHTASKLRVYNRTSPDQELVLKRKWIFGGGRRDDTAAVMRELARRASSTLPEKAQAEFMKDVDQALFKDEGKTRGRTIKGDVLARLDARLAQLKTLHGEPPDLQPRPSSVRLLPRPSSRPVAQGELPVADGMPQAVAADDVPSEAAGAEATGRPQILGDEAGLPQAPSGGGESLSRYEPASSGSLPEGGGSDAAARLTQPGPARESGVRLSVTEAHQFVPGADEATLPAARLTERLASGVSPQEDDGDRMLAEIRRLSGDAEAVDGYLDELDERLTLGRASERPLTFRSQDSQRESLRDEEPVIDDSKAFIAQLMAERQRDERIVQWERSGNELLAGCTEVSNALERYESAAFQLAEGLDTLLAAYEDDPGQRAELAKLHDAMRSPEYAQAFQDFRAFTDDAGTVLTQLREQGVELFGDDSEDVQWLDGIGEDIAALAERLNDAQAALEPRAPDAEALRARHIERIEEPLTREGRDVMQLESSVAATARLLTQTLGRQSAAIGAGSDAELQAAHAGFATLRLDLARHAESAAASVVVLTGLLEEARRLLGDDAAQVRAVERALAQARTLEARVQGETAKIVVQRMPEPVAAPRQRERTYANDAQLGRVLNVNLEARPSPDLEVALERADRAMRLIQDALKLAAGPEAASPEQLARLGRRVAAGGAWINVYDTHVNELREFQTARLAVLTARANAEDNALGAARATRVADAQARAAATEDEFNAAWERAVAARAAARSLGEFFGSLEAARDLDDQIGDLQAQGELSLDQETTLQRLQRELAAKEAQIADQFAALAPAGAELDADVVGELASRREALGQDMDALVDAATAAERARDDAGAELTRVLSEPQPTADRRALRELEQDMADAERVERRFRRDIDGFLARLKT